MIMLNNNLRLFIQVAEKGSVTQVANDQFISQPAVSRAIKTLEEELNVKLFFRDKRKGLILTEAGNKIFQTAIEMAYLENRIYQTAYSENNIMAGKLRIASMPILTSVILSKAIYRLKNKYPDVTVEILEGNTSEIRKAVEEHQVDFGICSSPFGNLDSRFLFYDHIVAINNKPVTAEKSFNLRENNMQFIICDAALETMTEKLKGQKINLDNCFSVIQAETVINLVEDGNGVGLISELVLNSTPNRLLRTPIVPAVELEIGLVATDLNDLTPVATAMKNIIEEVSSEYKAK